MKKSLKIATLSALTAAFLSSVSYAADLRGSVKDDTVPGVRVQNWSGLYVGAGVGFGHSVVGTEDDQGGIDIDGVVGGVRVGVDLARGSFLVGVLADYNVSNASLDLGGVTLLEQDEDWTIGGRLGFIHGNTLFYTLGGYTEVTYSSPIFGGADATLSGWKAGGGIEHMIAPNFSISLEATRTWLDLDDVATGLEDVLDATDDRVMLRAAYKINGTTFGF